MPPRASLSSSFWIWKLWRSWLILATVAALGLIGCVSDADMASADNFEIMRRVVFYNGITGDYILSIEGLCSLGNNDTAQRLTVTCKTGDKEYKKHFLGLSDNVTFFAEQLESANVSAYHYRVVFKPQSILPDVDFKADSKELLSNGN